MEQAIFKLNLNRAHFGSGSLDDAAQTLHADTVFSALALEALKMGGDCLLQTFVDKAHQGSLLVSDALPYIDEELFLPKPIMFRKQDASAEADKPMVSRRDQGDENTSKKSLKQLSFLPLTQIGAFMNGEADVDSLVRIQKELGSANTETKAAVRTGVGEDGTKNSTLPYRVGVFRFTDNAGLFLLIRADTEAMDIVERCLESLGHTGIGGKRSVGLGSFTVARAAVPSSLSNMLDAKDTEFLMTLACCLPADNEFDSTLTGATYILEKRSGYIYSQSIKGEPIRKRDVYKFKAGSCFLHRFEGSIVNVHPDGENAPHPVWSYAKPLFVGIGDLRGKAPHDSRDESENLQYRQYVDEEAL